ncbi:MAG TPA: hypothetical protein VFU88_12505 [Ktedonobacterales bacterium]|nr:hypothetical protein [Ktedonobacterales bacterium]
MPVRFSSHLRLALSGAAVLALVLGLLAANVMQQTPKAKAAAKPQPYCQVRPQLCTETVQPWDYQGVYTGHDEPSVLFYSKAPGSGNSNLYTLKLPADPPTLPAQDGSGGTWNFQLHPAFWLGMAMCDNQSAPLPGAACAPDSDTNIFNSTNPASAKYMGKHPGTGFMEMQFYPPGWGPVSCDATQWCAALNIDSFSSNSSTGQLNNNDCLNNAGLEYVNFAFITKNGVAQAPADPLDATAATFTPDPTKDLFMGSGDTLTVNLHDTPDGFQVVINDLTSGESGSMTASTANQFGHPIFDPAAASCTDELYAFHPMYATSSENTRVLWAAHSYNVAYSDEIGHFEYCNAISRQGGRCTGAGVTDPGGTDGDDRGCFTAPVGTSTTSLTGCLATDNDFDGPEYQHTWPGSNPNPAADAAVHATPITFTSPLFQGPGTSGWLNYSRVAFETNLPRIEADGASSNNNCQRHPDQPNPGAGCVNPPLGASFYPFFSTGTLNGACVWEEGDANIAGTTHPAGASSTDQFGGLVTLGYPSVGGPIFFLEDFRNALHTNPCPAPGGIG